ncbi:LA2681 family HEPN domain-containing protein [Staphylococcus simulans]|uniref:LA2681 family HEPN domain-containing protein n=1 Tax=Staphylococcus simulans TaxID=1286 RepID=UPI000D1D16EF|nr:LA2681 family HEPN domain-containing protein [Staphylococcus simulans]PTJ22591.1 hypothetical protein BU039_07780 [Staphylococcus simulans]
MKWYENSKLFNYASDADEALDKKDTILLFNISKETEKLSIDYIECKMVCANYLYISFTSLSNYITIKYQNIESLEWEELTEKCLVLARKSIVLMNDYLKEHNHNIKEPERAYFNGIYLSINVNYCNLLTAIGKYSTAIYEMRKLAITQFGMAIGNLGTEIFDYACLDYTNNKELLYKYSYQLLNIALTYGDDDVHPGAKEFYHNKMNSLNTTNDFNPYDTEYSVKSLLEEDGLDDYKLMKNNDNQDYWNWVAKNNLALNTLNDLDYLAKPKYDILHLPSILSPIDDYSSFYGIFNQIKQEYCSARYMLYEGIYSEKNHFSDENVYLVNTLDYPKYGLNIEKVKYAYRSAYALFDRIGYFLNKYFELGLVDRKVSFRSIWNSKYSGISKFFKNNIGLKGMYWTYKDLFATPISKDLSYIDLKLRRTYDIRNIMEHRYLKVLDSNFIEEASNEWDKLAYTITSDELNELGMNLFRTCRELIILLCFTVNINENNKEKSNKGHVINIPLDKFEDEWKN